MRLCDKFAIEMDSPKLGDKVHRVQQQGKRTNKQQHTTPEKETAEEESSPVSVSHRNQSE